jgi:hypothetical protein
MATNREFRRDPNAKKVDLSSPPPGPPPEPGLTWFGPEVGWKKVVVDDPEDREPLESAR